MKVINLINDLHDGATVEDVAKSLGVSRSTLGKKIKSLNYIFNQRLKKYEFLGDYKEKQVVDLLDVSDLLMRKESEKKPKDFGKKDDENNFKQVVEISNIEEQVFSVDEINALKEIVNLYKRDDIDMFLELAIFPYDGDKVKKSVMVDSDLYIDFERFAEKFEKKVSKFQLLDLAIYDFIKKYSD